MSHVNSSTKATEQTLNEEPVPDPKPPEVPPIFVHAAGVFVRVTVATCAHAEPPNEVRSNRVA